ncbi:MAG: ribosome rescue protein RqcH, partial [Candidatus Nanohaloarchaea archaeon]|nr:ribosome rescue protein RqcH [Candidatus Nanohaloarchaea archaeon]
ARIDKFYQRGDELVLHIYKPGDQKYRLLLAPGKAFLTRYKREMPDRPPGFAMFLRKQLSGAVIERVEQYDFDRVLELHTEEKVLIAELFGEGNVIMTDKAGEIEASLRSGDFNGREIYTGEEYTPPEATQPPAEVDAAFLRQSPGEDVVIVLATEAGLGGAYAEEVCARAGVDKNAAVEDLSDGAVQDVVAALHDLFQQLDSGSIDPQVYEQDGMPVAATPVPFRTYEEAESGGFDSFSAALDTYFTEREKAERREQKRERYEEEKADLEHRLEQQERKLEGLQQAAEENQEKAELIYENYRLVEDVLESIRTAREQHSESEIRERLESEQAEGVPEAEAIERLDFDNNEVVVDIGREVRLEIDTSVEKNAEIYYEKASDAEDKLPGLKESLQRTRQELEELEPEDIDVEDEFEDKEGKQAEKEWYEKFRWFFSSDGYLVIGGRDATTNDMLVKKYMENNDVYVHADFDGAPSVVVKNEEGGEREDIPEATLTEAGQFAVTFAQAWEAGVGSDDAYYVAPDQVTQEPESGEYLPTGSFVIRGDRTYLRNMPVEASVGAYNRDGRYVPMGGPTAAVEAQCDHYVELRQGRGKPSDVAKQVKDHLDRAAGADLELDAVIRALPPGKAEVGETH